MALAHRTLPRYGVQFHPESIGTPLGSQLLQNFATLTRLHAGAYDGSMPLPGQLPSSQALVCLEENACALHQLAQQHDSTFMTLHGHCHMRMKRRACAKSA